MLTMPLKGSPASSLNECTLNIERAIRQLDIYFWSPMQLTNATRLT